VGAWMERSQPKLEGGGFEIHSEETVGIHYSATIQWSVEGATSGTIAFLKISAHFVLSLPCLLRLRSIQLVQQLDASRCGGGNQQEVRCAHVPTVGMVLGLVSTRILFKAAADAARSWGTKDCICTFSSPKL
jgi:hypothetical protein